MSDPKVVDFYFGRRRMQGVEGEPIAKALFKAGVRTLSYSVKYRRPRGLHCVRGRCVMCHMEVDGTPGVPTCLAPLRAGARIEREDYRPFFAPLLTLAARVIPFPAGFYYRMFTRPALLRKSFLGSLHRMAGVGRLQTAIAGGAKRPIPTPGAPAVAPSYGTVVVGAGLSGMTAAIAEAEKNSSVLVIDEYDRPGGHSLGFQPDDVTAARDDLIDRFNSASNITYVPRTTAQAFYKPNRLLIGPGGAVEQTGGGVSRMQTVSASRFVFATGAYDLIPTFEGNDVPGIFGARAIRLLLERDGLVPGTRAIVYGTGPEPFETAMLLQHHGIEVVATVDPLRSGPAPTTDHLQIKGTALRGASGSEWVRAVSLEDGQRFECDLLCIALPGQGAYELAYQAGFSLQMTPGEIKDVRVMQPAEQSFERDGVEFFVTGALSGVHTWRDKTSWAARTADTTTPSTPTGRR